MPAVVGDPDWVEPRAGKLMLAWALLRVPAILAILLLLRRPIFAVVLRVFGIEGPTLFAIDLLSTPATRGLFFLALVVVLLLCVALTRRLSLPLAYGVTVLVGWGLVAVTYVATLRSMPYTLPAALLLATNLAPENWFRRLFPSRERRSMLMTLGVGVSEVLFLGRHLRWIVWLARGQSGRDDIASRWAWALPGILLAAGAGALLLKGHAVVPIEQAVRTPSTVRIVARDDFNWIQADNSGRYLYAIGYEVDHLLRYDMTNWSAPPVQSDTPTGGSQSFAYDPAAQELYVYDDRSQRLLYFDAATLKLKHALELKEVSPGDTWIALDKRTDSLTIVSEADEEVGSPLVMLDRASGKIIDEKPEEAGNILLNPQNPLLYLSFFRRTSEVEIYDLERHEVIRKTAIGDRAERMGMWERQNELLVTLPMESRIARLDGNTLETKGYFSTLFGVRAIAIDKGRNLLLCGSIATGKLVVIDLATGQQRASYYLGPWLRTIELLPERGIAYVSSNGAIYEVHYD